MSTIGNLVSLLMYPRAQESDSTNDQNATDQSTAIDKPEASGCLKLTGSPVTIEDPELIESPNFIEDHTLAQASTLPESFERQEMRELVHTTASRVSSSLLDISSSVDGSLLVEGSVSSENLISTRIHVSTDIPTSPTTPLSAKSLASVAIPVLAEDSSTTGSLVIGNPVTPESPGHSPISDDQTTLPELHASSEELDSLMCEEATQEELERSFLATILNFQQSQARAIKYASWGCN